MLGWGGAQVEAEDLFAAFNQSGDRFGESQCQSAGWLFQGLHHGPGRGVSTESHLPGPRL